MNIFFGIYRQKQMSRFFDIASFVQFRVNFKIQFHLNKTQIRFVFVT